MENIYKWAARECVKFQSPKGVLSVEDLFRVDLDILDQVYRSLKMQLRDAYDSDSLLDDNSGSEEAQDLRPASKEAQDLRLAIKLVTDVFKTRKEEAELAEKKLKRAKERQKIAEIIAEKEEEDLRSMSIEDLKGLLEESDE
jgi:hypothetical protein